jgi:hypothetical protein
VTSVPVPYWTAWNARLHKWVVIESATGKVVAESDDKAAAEEEADRLRDEWLKAVES